MDVDSHGLEIVLSEIRSLREELREHKSQLDSITNTLDKGMFKNSPYPEMIKEMAVLNEMSKRAAELASNILEKFRGGLITDRDDKDDNTHEVWAFPTGMSVNQNSTKDQGQVDQGQEDQETENEGGAGNISSSSF